MIDEVMNSNALDGAEMERLHDHIVQNTKLFKADDSASPVIMYVVKYYGSKVWTPSLITKLAAYGANLNGVPSETGLGALHMAVLNQYKSLVELLLESKADPNIASRKNQTPLHFACMQGNYDIVKLLVVHGANVNAPDIERAAPMHFVAGHSNTIEMPSPFKALNKTNRREHAKYLDQVKMRKEIIDLLIEKGPIFNLLILKKILPIILRALSSICI